MYVFLTLCLSRCSWVQSVCLMSCWILHFWTTLSTKPSAALWKATRYSSKTLALLCSLYLHFSNKMVWFVCLGLTSLLNIWGHIVPTCSSGTLTNVLSHRNAMPQIQNMTPHPVTVYRHGADLSLCYPLMWNVTLEYTTTHCNVLGQTRQGNPSPTFHTPANAQLDAVTVVNSRKLSRKYRTNRVLNTCGVQIHYAIRSTTATS